MSELFDPDRCSPAAMLVVIRATTQVALRGHTRVATLHLLLALLETEVGEVFREFGVTPEAVERETASLMRGSQAAAVDAEALSTLGIDLARIRAAVEAGFGPGALERAAAEPAPRRGLLSRLARRGRRRSLPFADERDALRTPRKEGSGFGFTSASLKALNLSMPASRWLADGTVDPVHLALGLLRGEESLVLAVLARLQVEVGALRSALEEQGRRSA